MVERIPSSSPLKSPKPGINPKNKQITIQEPAAEIQARQKEDVLELSQQARQVHDTQATERLRQIQTQIHAGFYNRPEIIRETASRIVRLLFNRDLRI